MSPLFTNEEVNLLFALRSRGTDCKSNFKNKYVHSNLLCPLCKTEIEDQKHILSCNTIVKEFKSDNVTYGTVEYDDIFSENINKQKAVTCLFKDMFRIRNKLIEEYNSQMAPSNTGVMLEISDPLLPCILNLFSRK